MATVTWDSLSSSSLPYSHSPTAKRESDLMPTIQSLVDSGLGQEVIDNTSLGSGDGGQGEQGSAQAQKLKGQTQHGSIQMKTISESKGV